MELIKLIENGNAPDLLIEKENGDGILSIGDVLASDMELVTGKLPQIRNSLEECISCTVLLIGTIGKSSLLDKLARDGSADFQKITGKRECFSLQSVTLSGENSTVKKLIVIAGSDKRGTIYGMFYFSEMCGVSPLVYFGDVMPAHSDSVRMELPYYSKEPSVKYRGFFINDEWPAFGNWAVKQFGGINAKAYEKIFQLLLRMKGNYLWPAMWRSSFSEDGPGLDNARLADKYGVIMGTSHHEPMCRAGVEWQDQYRKYGEDSAWSFISNDEAITRFWEDGLLRNLPFENVITIGMRGENDSKLLPEDATMKDNVEVVKNAIRTQHALIRKHTGDDFDHIPRMIAIYKEVEDYYFGDETCEGLKDWDELKDVIFLLSDDNYGNLRTLPTEEDRKHPGGFGMYYHFDYHGAPVSYEWANCNRLTKTWEQMTRAYESGIREMWIVNVGDLKNMEYPLSYFMDLAYDYDTWGIASPNRTESYSRKWIKKQFGDGITDAQADELFEVLEGYTKWNAIRSPESMKEGLFSAFQYNECDRVEEEIKSIIETADRLMDELSGDSLNAYISMIYHQAVISLNLILVYLDSARNKELAKRGCLYANHYADKVREGILKDIRLTADFHNALKGKWDHCLSSAHTGFRDWDDKDWTYPTCENVMPINGGKAVIHFRESGEYHLGAHWQDKGPLKNSEMTRPGCCEVLVCLDSRGNAEYDFKVSTDSPWLRCDKTSGRVSAASEWRQTLRFTADKTGLPGKVSAAVRIDIWFSDGKTTYSNFEIEADIVPGEDELTKDVCADLFYERNGICCRSSEHFSYKTDIGDAGFKAISYLGREGSAIKSFPVLQVYRDAGSAPYVNYSMITEEDASYTLTLYLLARNPAKKGDRMHFFISVNEDEPVIQYSLSEDFYTEWFNDEWASGVLEHIRKKEIKVNLKKGRNDIRFYAGDPGVMLEKLVLIRDGIKLSGSYLGPEESYFSCSLV